MKLNAADCGHVDKRHRDQSGSSRPERQAVDQMRCKLIALGCPSYRSSRAGRDLGRISSFGCPRSSRLLCHSCILSRRRPLCPSIKSTQPKFTNACIAYAVKHYHAEAAGTSICIEGQTFPGSADLTTGDLPIDCCKQIERSSADAIQSL